MRILFVFSIIFVTFALFASVSSSLHARQDTVLPQNQCEQATDTTDVMACVKKQNEKAQERLGLLFKKIIELQSGQNLKEFRIAQKDWIIYRDQECNWEVSQAETKSLKRISALSCLTRLTNLRSDVLEPIAAESEQLNSGEFRTFPRWINVLSAENPQIFWKYAEHIEVDLDMDDVNEEIIVGLKIVSENSGANIKAKAIVAIANNPATGRPQIKVFEFGISPDTEQKNPKVENVCDPNISVVVVSDNFGNADNKYVMLMHGKCVPLILSWNGDNYTWRLLDNFNDETRL